MSREIRKPRLQVVPKGKRKELVTQDFQVPMKGAQSNLFPTPRPGMLIFVYFPEVTEDEFRKALELSRPSTVFELRTTPRFDIGKLNRKAVFQYFDREHTTYVDVTSKMASERFESTILNEVARFFKQGYVPVDRPVMFLLSSYNLPAGFSTQITDLVSSVKNISPEVFSVPHFTR